MQLIAYLNFDGTCADAMRFYERCFGGKIEMMMTHGESPIAGDVAPDWHPRILHARLRIGDAVLMASDSPPSMHQPAQGFAVSLVLDDLGEGERIFGELSQGGTVRMPFEKTFWAERFGMVTDRFGIPWMVNCGLAM